MADKSDRISSLPDSVLCHILSFLPTKHAVSTSVLSKRWKPLYLSVPALDFDDQNHGENKDTYVGFVLFVYAVMLSRDITLPINRFRLKCVSSLCDPSNVNKWVNSAMQRSVQHLDLSLPSSVNLSSGVLGSRTLVVVKLSGLTVNAVYSVGFPSLKILHLKRVHFPKHRYLVELLSGCPILEDLLTKLLHIRQRVIYSAGFKSLPNLVRADVSFPNIPLRALYNVEFLRIKVSLNYFRNVIPSLNNLTHLEIFSLPSYCDWLVEMLDHCPKLQILLIDKKEMNRNDSENWAYPQTVPECLSSHLRTCSLIKYEGHDGELRFARYVMQSARVLRNMKICSTSPSNSQEKLEMIKKLSMCPRSSATCKLSFE